MNLSLLLFSKLFIKHRVPNQYWNVGLARHVDFCFHCVVLMSVLGYCVLTVPFLGFKFTAGPKLVYVAYKVTTRVNFFVALMLITIQEHQCMDVRRRGCCPLPESAVRRDLWYPKHCPFLLWFRTGNSYRREIWLSLESLVLLFMDKSIETIRAISNKKQSCY